MTASPILLDNRVTFEEDPNDGLLIKRSQELPDEYLTALKLEKADSISTPMGEMHRFCTIPEHLVDEWGFEYIMNADPQDILRRLRQAQLDAFITTNRRI
jgi:hypothetical protein